MDTIFIPGVRCHPLDPSQSPEYSWNIRDKGIMCKTIFDCTVPYELKDKFNDVVTKLQDSDQYSKLKDQVDNVIVQVNDKINEVKEKMSEQEFDDFSDLEDEINDIEDDLNVIIDDLKD